MQEIVVYGSQEPAKVALDNDGVMYFKPTCVDTTSTRSYGVRNLSRLPINFEWRLKHSDSAVLSVHPTFGTIQPNETQVVVRDDFILSSNFSQNTKAPCCQWQHNCFKA